MTERKSNEELEVENNKLLVEYNQLLQSKLDAERKDREAQELAAQKQKEKAEWEAEFKKKYNLTAESRLETPTGQPTNMTAETRSFEQFRADFARHKGLKLTGKRYEDLIEGLQYGKGSD